MEKNKRIKCFCFTWANYTDTILALCQSFIKESAKYAIIGKEVAPTTGMKHLQGYISLKTPRRWTTIKNTFPGAHIEPSRGSDQQNRDYCSKGGDFQEWGELNQGRRSDIIAAKDAILAGASHDTVIADHAEVLAKYPKFIKELEEKAADAACPKTELPHPYVWQLEIILRIQQIPDDRTIIWVCDTVGGKGKTKLARYLVDNHNAFYTNGGRGIDIAFAYNREPIVIFDYVRESQEWVNYGIIEALKNGIVSSNKYVSITKRFNPPHVIVMANFKPLEGKFSSDRIKLIEL